MAPTLFKKRKSKPNRKKRKQAADKKNAEAAELAKALGLEVEPPTDSATATVANVTEDGADQNDTKEDASKKPLNSSTSEDAPAPIPAPKPISIRPDSFHAINPRLSDGVLSAISHFGFETMTPVQQAAMPLFLTNKDVCVQAVTGSGKTLAFLVPMVEMILRRTDLLNHNQVGGLVISPTRELARQTYNVAKELCRFASLSEPLLLVGGGGGHRPVAADLEKFASDGSDIVIGTPGRIDDILSRYSELQLNELECLVLDEGDVLLDMGFEVTLSSILSKLPRMRRTGIFSATRSGTTGAGASAKSVKKLMNRAGLRNPVMINVAIASAKDATATPMELDSKDVSGSGSCKSSTRLAPHEQATPSSLTNYFIVSPLDEKLSRLVAFLKQHKDEKVIVFFLTCALVEFYGQALQDIMPKYYMETLHGKLAPKRREKAMERFRNGGAEDGEEAQHRVSKGSVLLCTDIAARGLDVPDIEWTIQFDAPTDPSQYIHRVGRSARAGRCGSSLIFVTPKEDSFVDFLRLRKVPIEEIKKEERCAPSRSIVPKNDTDMVQDDQEQDMTITNILPKIRNLVLGDRDLLEKGTKAYTSYIRAYKEHHCSFIFRIASLDLGVLATSFCLLRLPKMPELRDKYDKLNFTPAGPEVDIYAIQFKDKSRERARQKRLAAELAAGGKNAKQIKAEQRVAAKIQRKKDIRKENIQKGRNPNKKRGRQAQMYDEWDELAKEERLYKKLKQKKITEKQFKELMYGTKDDSDEEMLDSDTEC